MRNCKKENDQESSSEPKFLDEDFVSEFFDKKRYSKRAVSIFKCICSIDSDFSEEKIMASIGISYAELLQGLDELLQASLIDLQFGADGDNTKITICDDWYKK